jgi:lipopolysaccharide/colanic/teichoic acid biosynthesis glycosyltransferase
MYLMLELKIKRVFDVLVCLLVLFFGLPFLILLCILVKMSSPGPVFFVQKRVGYKMKPFQMIKFRTMIGNQDPQKKVWDKNEEQRITKLGAFLRDFGIDELPQVINILKGDMSIIGPRPILSSQLDGLPKRFFGMFDMRPGVLSLSAMEGRRSVSLETRYGSHVKYVENWSLFLDFKIFIGVFIVVFKNESSRERV